MLFVTVGNNVSRETVNLEHGDVTLRSVLDNAGIDYSRSSVNLDGAPLKPGDLDKTFNDFGITSKCYLLAVTKTDNA